VSYNIEETLSVGGRGVCAGSAYPNTLTHMVLITIDAALRYTREEDPKQAHDQPGEVCCRIQGLIVNCYEPAPQLPDG